MRELNTIQKREKLNGVFATDENGNGGANHVYDINYESFPVGEAKEVHHITTIKFQNGDRKEDNSTHGVIDSDLLEEEFD